MRVLAPFVVASALIAAAPAYADTYTKANFSGGIFGGSANVRSPFNSAFSPGETFTGSFVFDNQLVPAAGSGFTNVAFSTFPDIAGIPAADAFTLNFGSYVFTLANDPAAAIQYNNGNFNGFVFNTSFVFQGNSYLFNLSGGTFSVFSAADPFGQPYINGYINIGNQAVTGRTPFTPQVPGGAVPEPATWAMMMLGFGALAAGMRRRPVNVRVRYA